MKEARNLKPIKAFMKIDFVISKKRDAAEMCTGYGTVKTPTLFASCIRQRLEC
jgi:hypothetical protein